MLIKELSRSSRIHTKELLKVPVGLSSYIIDCMKSGNNIYQAIGKAFHYPLSPSSIHEVLKNEGLLHKLSTSYSNIDSIQDIINIC